MSQQIGHFEIIRRLEAKADAASYLGRDTRDGSTVIVDTWAAETTDAQALFLKRAAPVGRLEHASIARILDFGIDGATSCRIEQCLGAETLPARLERCATLPIATALAWLSQVAQALQYAHESGVVHGDLHPGAITIRDDDTAAVRGFASPRRLADATYAAPESARGGAVDARTDIYAFGALTHRLLTFQPGELPATSQRIEARDRRVLEGALKSRLPPAVADSLVLVLQVSLRDDPAARAASFTPISSALRRAREALVAGAAGAEAPSPNEATDWTATAVQKPQAADASLIEVELSSGAPSSAPAEPAEPPTPEPVRRRSLRSRLRRRWLTFATVAGAALWLGGTLWWSKGSPVAGSEAPTAQDEAPFERSAGAGGTDDETHAAQPADERAPRDEAPRTGNPTEELGRGIGRLALAPAWDPRVTVSIDGGASVTLDRRRVFELEADVDHVLAFELATRDYQIREQVTTRVGVGRLLETPVPLHRPGTVSIAPATESERPVFVRIGDEAVGWTPVLDLPVPAGVHQLSLFRNPTWQPEDRVDQTIRVRSRKQTTVEFELEAEPAVLVVNGRRIEHVPPQPEAAPVPAQPSETPASTAAASTSTD